MMLIFVYIFSDIMSHTIESICCIHLLKLHHIIQVENCRISQSLHLVLMFKAQFVYTRISQIIFLCDSQTFCCCCWYFSSMIFLFLPHMCFVSISLVLNLIPLDFRSTLAQHKRRAFLVFLAESCTVPINDPKSRRNEPKQKLTHVKHTQIILYAQLISNIIT